MWRPDLLPGKSVRNGDFAGLVVSRETTRNARGPHREVRVRYPDGSESVHVGDETDVLETLD